MAIKAQFTAVSDYLFRRLFRVLFRYDIFISYARRDGKGYALKLKEQLTRLDFSCFLDYEELPAGNSLNRTLKRAIKRSATIIVVGTEGALKSHYVELEVGEFARTGRSIIPIDFEGTLAGAPWPVVKERDLVWVDETKDALAKSVPSPPVADAVDKLFKYTRRNVRVRGQVIATAALFLIGAAISVLVIRQQVAAANVQRHEAEVARVSAQQEQVKAEASAERAKHQEDLAKASAITAQEKEQEAKDKTEEARKQGELARQQTAEAQKQAALARAKAEEARQQQLLAEAQQKLASSRQLAANAMSQLQIDPELSLVLAGKSAETVRTFEAEEALRRSLLESHVRVVAEGHTGEVTRASFTPDGEFVVAAGPDNTARVLRLSDGQIVAQLRGHTQPIQAASFSSDGRLVVTASDDKTARVWDWRANRVVVELPHPEAVSSAKFSPNGAAVVTTSKDNAARVWDAQTGRRLSPILYGVRVREYHASNVITIKPFSPDGRYVFFVRAKEHEEPLGDANSEGENDHIETGTFAAGPEGHESVWDVNAGGVVSVSGLEKLSHVLAGAINTEQKLMVTHRAHTKGNGPTELWDLDTGRRFAVIQESSEGSLNGLAVSPDGRFIVTANSDNTARVWAIPEKRESGESGKSGTPDETGDRSVEAEGQVLDKPLWVLSGHRGPVQKVTFSPDGKFILTASDDRTARVWDVKTGREVSVLRGHRRGVLSAAFSPDGNRMITSGDDGVARVWDESMGQDFRELGTTGKITRALFAARSNLVLTTDNEQSTQVWYPGSGKNLPRDWAAHIAALSPDGTMIVTAKQEVPRVYEVTTGRVRLELSGQEGEVLSAVHSPDGRFIATVESNKGVRVREAETSKLVKELAIETGNAVSLQFSPGGGDFLLIGSSLWEWKTERPPIPLAAFGGQGRFAAFSPDGRLVAGPSGQSVLVWDTRTGCRTPIRMQHKAAVLGASFGKDGHTLLTVDPYAAKLWQIPATLKCEGREEILKESLELGHAQTGSFAKKSALLGPDGRFIVLTGGKGVQVHDASTGVLKFKLSDGSSTRPPAAGLSSDGKLIVTASQDGNARVWDSETGKLLRTLEGSPTVPLSTASFGPGDKLIVTVSDPHFNLITLWDAATGRRLAENLRGHSASFSPDGKSVLTVSGGDLARVSEISNGRTVAELQGLTGKVTHILFSNDGLRVVAATSDRRVGAWEAATGRNLGRHEYAGDIKSLTLNQNGKLIATLTEVNYQGQAHTWDTETDTISRFGELDVDDVALSPDGEFIATSTNTVIVSKPDATEVWSTRTSPGKPVANLPGHFAAFSPDSKRMLTVNGDMALVWDAGSWDTVAELRGHTGPIKSAAFSSDGNFIVTTAERESIALVWDAETGTVQTGLFGDINYGLSSAAFSPDGKSILVIGDDNTARLYGCVMCGQWDELIARARERFARHARQMTPDEQKKFMRQTP